MLKKRIVATLVVKDGIVVQSLGFNRYLPVGKPAIAVEFLNQWGIDEIILLDISAGKERRAPDYALVRAAAAHCRVPLTIGGGITHLDQIKQLMQCGADKVSLNQSALNSSELITEASQVFGDQCIVASIDAIRTENGHRVYDYRQRNTLALPPAILAEKFQRLGAGEILINSVDRDGSYRGFDIELINKVCAAVTVPVICCGGAGNAQHFIEVLTSTNVSAAAAANYFHFTEHSVTTTKAMICRALPVRHEVHAHYNDSQFDAVGRLQKRSDQELEDLLFVRIESEII
jgi:imidazole glycerol-phosphate synthase subunit HisF